MHGNHLGVFWYGRPQVATRFVYHIASCFLVLRSLVESCVLAIAPTALCGRVILVSDVIGSHANAADEPTSVRYSTGCVDSVAVAVSCGKTAHLHADHLGTVDAILQRQLEQFDSVQVAREFVQFFSDMASTTARLARAA